MRLCNIPSQSHQIDPVQRYPKVVNERRYYFLVHKVINISNSIVFEKLRIKFDRPISICFSEKSTPTVVLWWPEKKLWTYLEAITNSRKLNKVNSSHYLFIIDVFPVAGSPRTNTFSTCDSGGEEDPSTDPFSHSGEAVAAAAAVDGFSAMNNCRSLIMQCVIRYY